MTSSPVVALAIEGIGAITMCRKLMGATFGADADAGTIRGDFGMSFSNNLVHASDGTQTAQSELALWFGGEDELVDWKPSDEHWLYNVAEELN